MQIICLWRRRYPADTGTVESNAREPIDMPMDYEAAEESLRPGRGLRHPRLREAAVLLDNNQLRLAEKALHAFLNNRPKDVNALHLLGAVAQQEGLKENARTILAECVALAPDFASARYSYANALLDATRPEMALAEAEILLRRDPQNPMFRVLKATALEATEEHAEAVALWRVLAGEYPGRPDLWMRYGHALRSVGAREDCIAAFRKVIELAPAFGGSYWSLADLKTFRFSDADIAQMEKQLTQSGLSAEDHTQMLFALGKAYADLALYEKSFQSYAKGNALRRLMLKYDPERPARFVGRNKRVFTEDFFRARAGFGSQSAAPIFLVGMPRAGSTLVEQILASHSQIEGTRELSDLTAVFAGLQTGDVAGEYPAILEKQDRETFERLGERYLETAHAHRKLKRPFFTDKMGPNFAYTGLLHSILPNAKIVDVRRHPLACGFSNFVQYFAKGQGFTFRLADIGRYYRDYVELMAHFDRVLPGKVHRLFYEDLVANPEAEVRRLLDHLSLPFEPACLEFYKTDRVVTTASSEQVRKPIYRLAVDQWRHYEQWLEPLKAALGPVLDAYPDVPTFD